MRPETLARQGSADGVRREPSARRAVRPRRRHSRPRAGGCLRPRPRRAERARRASSRNGRTWAHRAFRNFAHARLRPVPPVDRRARWCHLRRRSLARRQAHRHHLPRHARAVPEGQRDRGGDRHAVGRGRDRAASRSFRRHLRPRVDRLDVAGESPARGAGGAREPSRADPDAGTAARVQGRVDRTAAACASTA